jgi:hypothetical protein
MVPMNDIVIIQNLISILEVGELANAVRADLLWQVVTYCTPPPHRSSNVYVIYTEKVIID